MDFVAWFDIIIVAAILMLGIKGILNGLIKEVFGLIGLVGGLVVATRFSEVAEKFINENIYKFDNASMLQFVGFIALWIVFWFLCILIGKFMSKLVALSGLGFLDRFGGFVAGSGKIFLVLAAVCAVLAGTNLNSKVAPYFQNSKVYPILMSAGNWIINVDIKNIKNEMDDLGIKRVEPNKTDIFITTDENASNEIEVNATKGE
ncbi:CvpA family protein [Campylobacter sp. RM13119]|uniref:CvpA family protein n=1 Tax=Campylobacter californiensis TaxID=1032243 RepID=A0ABD4JI36_9BACT|nr:MULTISPECIES: CvpA family protein [unclassified Campylobacter]MBE2986416.1 CvpA family protein [Campylobacter sp. RM12919]MBE2988712.1 CvpA family protein [Campylobacter sp. RM12920]MBE3022815.1 CvpA family protein [Campylobacter sp. 7477a]MBE3605662.1 CvpA family protein [Campylobacter sp. RM13119]MBE3609871.1 CvpA family protein [Campylobacter sp. RM12916]